MSNQFQYPFNPIEWPAVPHDFTGEYNLGIYTSETTQRYVYGTRYLTWDGRVYKYTGVTTNGVTSYTAAHNTLGSQTSWSAATVNAKGSRSMIITDATAVAVDSLAGGMVQIYDSTIANSHQIHIVGNELGNTTNIKIYLEFPLPITTSASDNIEMFENPYRLLDGGLTSNDFAAWIGVPCVTAATGYNVWTQTWGPCVTSPGNTTLDDAAGGERTVLFYAHGTLMENGDARVTIGENQIAGYILNAGTPDIAGPQIYLMCST